MKPLVLVAALLLFAPSVFAQTPPPYALFVQFQPGAVNPPFPREESTQTPLCGISYIDSINRVNGCRWFVRTGIPALPATMNYYHVFFKDSVNLVALASAYAANPNVVADTNCDGVLSASDIVTLLNIMFAGRPAC